MAANIDSPTEHVQPEAEKASICPICHEDIDYFSYGSCNHPTCVKCVLKLRKFGTADEPDYSKCPTCRRNLNRILISETFTAFDVVSTSNLRHDTEYDFLFCDEAIEHYYRKLLKSICPICGEEKNSLSALNRHTTMEHQVSYCDLCIRYARLLPCEFLPMTSSALATHRNWDKKRKKGHPMCEFCDERFYELEDLIYHVRDSHFFCDLCMTEGQFVAFREQHQLLQHYSDSHFLCKECRDQQRITCFGTADRLGLHRLQEHPKEAKNDPDAWLPISIEVARDTGVGLRGAPSRSRAGVTRVGGILDPLDGTFITDTVGGGVRVRLPNPAEWTGNDFPSLSSAGDNSTRSAQPTSRQSNDAERRPATQADATQPPRATLATVTGSGRSVAFSTNDFPALQGPAGRGPETGTASVVPGWGAGSNATASACRPAPTSQPVKKKPAPVKSDFPSLSSDATRNNLSEGTTSTPRWVAPGGKKSTVNNAVGVAGRSAAATAASTVVPSPPTANDFPALPDQGSKTAGRRVVAPPPLPPYRPDEGSRPTRTVVTLKTKSSKTCRTADGKEKRQQPDKQSSSESNRHDNAKHQPASSRWYDGDDTDMTERPAFSHIQIVNSLPSCPPPSNTAASNASADFVMEDFPSLSTSEKSTANTKVDRKAGRPVAVVTQKKPVKQNEVKVSAVSCAALKAAQNGVIDTELILFEKTPYTAMSDIDARNRKLIQTVELALSETGIKTAFAQFADLSRRYRHSQLTASAYVEGLAGLLSRCSVNSSGNDGNDKKDTTAWVAETIALLPHVGLQRALVRVLHGHGAPRLPSDLTGGAVSRQKDQRLEPPVWAKSVLNCLHTCAHCGQVCLRTDAKAHNQAADHAT